jgi:hypothetical protein
VEIRGAGEGAFLVDPWPFASPTLEVRCEGRVLVRSYEDEDDVRRRLEEAAPVTLVFRLVSEPPPVE